MMTAKKEKTAVGQEVFTMCDKCKVQLDHVVVSLNMDGIIEDVKCDICGSEHKYLSEKKVSPRKGMRAKKKDPARDFELLAEKFKEKKPVHYSTSGLFKADDVIDHDAFGIGIVVSTSYQKMDVIFSDQPRMLVYNRQM
jgi:hypothetical protein